MRRALRSGVSLQEGIKAVFPGPFYFNLFEVLGDVFRRKVRCPSWPGKMYRGDGNSASLSCIRPASPSREITKLSAERGNKRDDQKGKGWFRVPGYTQVVGKGAQMKM